jgi:phosphoribosyl-ATP pyrophosphohydrolase
MLQFDNCSIETEEFTVEKRDILSELHRIIIERAAECPDGSYTAYLFEQGEDKILKKIGEEASELIIASKNGNSSEIAGEAADLVYHLLVLLAWHDMAPGDVLAELAVRHNKKVQ